MTGKLWTSKQEEFLIENLGKLSYDKIGEKVGKKGKAVRQKKIRMKLGNPKDILDYVTIKYLEKIIHSSTRTINKWIEKHGLKATYKNVAHNQKISRIKLNDFWNWAEENYKLINWNKFEFENLGIEPKWTKKVRRDCKRNRITWTTKRERLLESYIKIGFSYKQISKNMNLTTDAVRSRHNLILKREDTQSKERR
jgi:hypothetical protein